MIIEMTTQRVGEKKKKDRLKKAVAQSIQMRRTEKRFKKEAEKSETADDSR